MAQLWKGRFKKELAKETNDFNSSISFDCRMFEEDIKGSIAHATMLGATGIIDKNESDKSRAGRCSFCFLHRKVCLNPCKALRHMP